jgi:hypothetical protein
MLPVLSDGLGGLPIRLGDRACSDRRIVGRLRTFEREEALRHAGSSDARREPERLDHR